MNKFVRYPLFFVIFFLTGILTAYLTFIILTTTKSHEVPVLVGTSLLDANKTLHEMKLFIKIEGETYDADIPAGYILKQEIPAGNRIKEGRTIGVIISKGPKMLYVPMLSGLLIDEAETLIKQNNIQLERIIRVHSPTVEKNRVIGQDPNPEEQGAGGMTLIVSAGSYDEVLICPSFHDMSIDKARDLAQKLGLETLISGDGTVVESQVPYASSLIKKGDTIRLKLAEEKENKWWF